MKLLSVVILSTYAIAAFAAFDGTGPHNDGRFLASAIVGGRACANANEFNLLEPDPADSTIPKLYDDDTGAITNCVPCSNGGTFKAVYGAQATGFTLAALNRNECCYNEDLAVCQEMMRAYQEGCNSGGVDGGNRPSKDDGTAGTCAA